MGVVNITPNSFSDGGKNHCINSLKRLLSDFDILDIGAESTAPFNNAISSMDELSRFENDFFPYLFDVADPCKAISIDTYKPEVFYEVALMINRFWPKTKIIFNDISGKVDSELLYLLKDSLKFDYVLCHNLCLDRSLANNHMEFFCSDIVESVNLFFKEHSRILDFKRNVYADPCFGFSKSYLQNHKLLRELHTIDSLKLYSAILVGISKKSFLRMPKNLDLKNNMHEIEQIHSNILTNLFQRIETDMIIRSHSVIPIISAQKSLDILGC